MLKQIKSLGLVLVMAGMLVGCESEVKDVELQDTNTIEQTLTTDEGKGEIDGKEWHENNKRGAGFGFTLGDVVDRCKELVDNGEVKNPEEYFRGVLKHTNYENLTDEEALAKMLDEYNMLVEIEKSFDELNIDDNATIEMKDEYKSKEKENKVEEKQVQLYCEWCESNTDHNSNDHIGMCYTCGIEKPASQMEFNGRSFHCGCENTIIANCNDCGTGLTRDTLVVLGGFDLCQSCYDARTAAALEESEEDLILCPGCDVSMHVYDAVEDSEGRLYCHSCYDSIFNSYEEEYYTCPDCGVTVQLYGEETCNCPN